MKTTIGKKGYKLKANLRIEQLCSTINVLSPKKVHYEDFKLSTSDDRAIRLYDELLEQLEGVTKALSRMIDKHDPDSIEAEWIGHAHETLTKAKGKL